jgi:hypothetical protein
MRALDTVRRHPSALLLAVQLVGILLYPAMEAARGGRLAFESLSLVVLVLAVYAVRATPNLTWVSVILGLPAFVLSFADYLYPGDTLDPYSAGLHAAFYFYAASSLIRYVLEDHDVTSDELFATGATFTLVAWGFAYVYQLVQLLSPGSFVAAVNPGADRSWMELLFMSFTTLTSTGLSDVIPVTPYARSVVMFEQLAGVAFLAMVVSRLVALLAARRTR